MPGEVTLRSTNPNLTVRALLDEAGAKVTKGYGGWSIIPRPRRLGMTQWDGREPFEMSVGLMLDGFKDNESVEVPCSSLERMALPPRDLAEPPVVRISGPVPHDDLSWVINGIEWGDVIRNESGLRVRQRLTVSLLRYSASDRIQLRPAAERARSKPAATGSSSAGARTYIVKAGDTLSGIAAKFYRDAGKWKKIADANGIRDPKNLKVGQKLRIP